MMTWAARPDHEGMHHNSRNKPERILRACWARCAFFFATHASSACCRVSGGELGRLSRRPLCQTARLPEGRIVFCGCASLMPSSCARVDAFLANDPRSHDRTHLRASRTARPWLCDSQSHRGESQPPMLRRPPNLRASCMARPWLCDAQSHRGESQPPTRGPLRFDIRPPPSLVSVFSSPLSCEKLPPRM